MDNFLKNLTPEEADLNLEIFNLILSRVLKRAYLNLDEADRKNMEQVFLSGSGDKKIKENFVKKHIPNFKTFFEEEAKKIEEEIKVEIERQV